VPGVSHGEGTPVTERAIAKARRPAGDGDDSRYWDEVAEAWRAASPQGLWRAHSDAVNIALFARWLPPGGVVLKTDVFDEAVGEGFFPRLAAQVQSAVGIDVSAAGLCAARSRYPRLRAVRADVRRLPFAGESFDAIISNSTLDHFASPDDISVSLRELRRVLRPGGHLLLTLDNRANPVIALRGLLPYRLLHRLGVVPYFVGATFGPAQLRVALMDAGLDVLDLEAVMHCPRVFAVAASRVVERRTGPAMHRRFLRCMMAFERLARWPTRFRTGHFVAVRATRR
jgi:SAM-dependent methyltransferase